MPTATLNGWIWALTTGFNPSSPFAGSNPLSPATQFCYFGASGDLPEKSRHSVR